MYVVLDHMLIIASLFGINEEVKNLIDNGGNAREISDITNSSFEAAQEILDIGEDLRCYDYYAGVFFGVLDKRICLHSIRNATRISLDEPISMIWTDDRTYAELLISTFELLWAQAIPAAQRINDLLKQRLCAQSG